MPVAFRLINHVFAGDGSKNPKVSCSSLSLQDLIIFKKKNKKELIF